jgi:hypothetical protein
MTGKNSLWQLVLRVFRCFSVCFRGNHIGVYQIEAVLAGPVKCIKHVLGQRKRRSMNTRIIVTRRYSTCCKPILQHL